MATRKAITKKATPRKRRPVSLPTGAMIAGDIVKLDRAARLRVSAEQLTQLLVDLCQMCDDGVTDAKKPYAPGLLRLVRGMEFLDGWNHCNEQTMQGLAAIAPKPLSAVIWLTHERLVEILDELVTHDDNPLLPLYVCFMQGWIMTIGGKKDGECLETLRLLIHVVTPGSRAKVAWEDGLAFIAENHQRLIWGERA